MDKKTIAVVFGGQSSEHEISCISVATVLRQIDESKYNILIIGITKAGRWLKVDSIEAVEDGSWREGTVGAILSPDASMKGVLFLENGHATLEKVDVVFPVLHGLWGEDGTIQGVLELAGIPYVGCGVLASAVSMDKLYTKIIVDTLGIRVESRFSYPVFVKPSCAGSSKGVSKATDRESLIHALEVAAAEDVKILVEEMIVGRELEFAIFNSGETEASGIGEILAAADFYDYDAKYNNAESRTVIDPELPEGKMDEIREAAKAIFQAVDGCGLARVDFFLEKDTNRVIFNEINTLPGFTAISMYPMLWEARGRKKPELVEALIQSAYTRRA